MGAMQLCGRSAEKLFFVGCGIQQDDSASVHPRPFSASTRVYHYLCVGMKKMAHENAYIHIYEY